MTNFLAMGGGYGRFVWSAYAVSGASLAAAVLWTVRAYFRAARQLRELRGESKRPL